jgi:hypothetical protein
MTVGASACARRAKAAAVAIAASSALALAQAAPHAPGSRVGFTLDSGTSAWQTADLDGDGRQELLTLGRDGSIATWSRGDDGEELRERKFAWRLERPAQSLVDVAELGAGKGLEILVLDDRGVSISQLGASASDVTTTRLADAGRLRVRPGAPRFAPLTTDLNGDGRRDLVLPIGDVYEIWLAGTDDFQLSQRVPMSVTQRADADPGDLSRAWRNEYRIPGLDALDLNGDGRLDLRAEEGRRRRFFLQAPNGTFAAKPIELDLEMFRDTTPRAEIELGETAVFGDDQDMQSADLDGDGIPDYVIAHRRKLWVFRSSKDGPQFTKPETRVVAEDISGILLLLLDDDERTDLLTFKLAIPSAVQLALGLVSSIDIAVDVFGYPTGADGTFARSASARRTLTIRVPSLLRLIGEGTSLVQRLLEVVQKLRWSTVGDADGDGKNDLALVSEDERSIELWLEPASDGANEDAASRSIRELLFENPDTVFDVERILRIAAQLLDAQNVALTGDRPADRRMTLDHGPDASIVDLFWADFDGSGRAATVIVIDRGADRDRVVEVLRW